MEKSFNTFGGARTRRSALLCFLLLASIGACAQNSSPAISLEMFSFSHPMTNQPVNGEQADEYVTLNKGDLDANDGFRGPAMEIELEYFDAGAGEIALDYDSSDVWPTVEGAYKRHSNILHRANTGQWQAARFRINDARFANRENGGADFRFYNGGDDLLIRAVRVRRVAP